MSITCSRVTIGEVTSHLSMVSLICSSGLGVENMFLGLLGLFFSFGSHGRTHMLVAFRSCFKIPQSDVAVVHESPVVCCPQ